MPRGKAKVSEAIENPIEGKPVKSQVEIDKEQSEQLAAQAIIDFESKYDRKKLILKDIEDLKEDYRRIKGEKDSLLRDYNATVQALNMVNAEFNSIQKEKENLKEQISKEKKADIESLKKKQESLDGYIKEYEALVESVKKQKKDVEDTASAHVREVSAFADDKKQLYADLEARENNLKTEQGKVNAEIARLEKIKTESNAAIGKLNIKSEEIRKNTEKLESLKESIARDYKEIEDGKSFIKSEEAKLEAKRLRDEKEIESLKDHYDDRLTKLKAIQADAEMKKLEAEALEARVNKLIKKHQLEAEVKS